MDTSVKMKKAHNYKKVKKQTNADCFLTKTCVVKANNKTILKTNMTGS